jgi:hypothetical protein
MRKSYFIDIDGGKGIYFHTLKAAWKAFNVRHIGEHSKTQVLPLTLECHVLTNDCFERTYNDKGGFIKSREIIESRPYGEI